MSCSKYIFIVRGVHALSSQFVAWLGSRAAHALYLSSYLHARFILEHANNMADTPLSWKYAISINSTDRYFSRR
jgi:hypothetical protein